MLIKFSGKEVDTFQLICGVKVSAITGPCVQMKRNCYLPVDSRYQRFCYHATLCADLKRVVIVQLFHGINVSAITRPSVQTKRKGYLPFNSWYQRFSYHV